MTAHGKHLRSDWPRIVRPARQVIDKLHDNRPKPRDAGKFDLPMPPKRSYTKFVTYPLWHPSEKPVRLENRTDRAACLSISIPANPPQHHYLDDKSRENCRLKARAPPILSKRQASCASSSTWLFSRYSIFCARIARRDPQVFDLKSVFERARTDSNRRPPGSKLDADFSRIYY